MGEEVGHPLRRLWRVNDLVANDCHISLTAPNADFFSDLTHVSAIAITSILW